MPSKPQSRLFIAGLALAGGLLLLFFINPALARWFPRCPFRLLTGFDCPGCGSGRGLHCLLHGDWRGAADYNLLLIPSLLLLASGFYYKLSGRGALLWAFFNRPAIALYVICAFWILRNIPVAPLSWLSSAH